MQILLYELYTGTRYRYSCRHGVQYARRIAVRPVALFQRRGLYLAIAAQNTQPVDWLWHHRTGPARVPHVDDESCNAPRVHCTCTDATTFDGGAPFGGSCAAAAEVDCAVVLRDGVCRRGRYPTMRHSRCLCESASQLRSSRCRSAPSTRRWGHLRPVPAHSDFRCGGLHYAGRRWDQLLRLVSGSIGCHRRRIDVSRVCVLAV